MLHVLMLTAYAPVGLIWRLHSLWLLWYFKVAVPLTTGDTWFKKLKEAVEKSQMERIWMSETKVFVLQCFCILQSCFLYENILLVASEVSSWSNNHFAYTVSVCNQPTRSTQPCIPPGTLNRVPALLGKRWECYLCWVAGNTVWSRMACEFP